MGGDKQRYLGWGLSVAIGLGMWSCGDKVTHDGLPTIDLEKAISTGDFDKLNRKDWKVETIQLAETDSTILGPVFLAGVNDTNVWVYDTDKVYKFSKTGECVSILSKKGQGPGEYRDIISAVVLPEDRIVVTDLIRVNMYSDERNLLVSQNDIIKKLLTAGTDLVGLGYSPESWKQDNVDSLLLIQMNDNLSKTDSIKLPLGQVNNGLLFETVLLNVNGKPGVLSADTVFNVTQEGAKIPELTFYTGKLSLPPEVAGDWDKFEERNNYISIFDTVLWNDLAFLDYAYDGKNYFDIWSIKDNTLLFRNKVSGIKDGIGMPLEMPDGNVMRIWPTHVIDGKLAGVIYPIFQMEEAEEDSNPGVFIISTE